MFADSCNCCSEISIAHNETVSSNASSKIRILSSAPDPYSISVVPEPRYFAISVA